MASPSKVFFSFLFLSAFMSLSVTCIQFDVGGKNGWKTPKSKHDLETYNQWASKNRFIVGDSLHFMYAKDSVLLVTQEEYEKCHSSHPEFFANSGHTIFHFDRAGLFYFISGISGHCKRGQKLIVKVLEPANAPQSAASHNSTTEKSQGSAIGAFAISSTTVVPFLMSFIGVLFA